MLSAKKLKSLIDELVSERVKRTEISIPVSLLGSDEPSAARLRQTEQLLLKDDWKRAELSYQVLNDVRTLKVFLSII